MHISFCVNIHSHFFSVMPRTEIAGSYGNCVFNYRRLWLHVFLSNCTNLHFHHQYINIWEYWLFHVLANTYVIKKFLAILVRHLTSWVWITLMNDVELYVFEGRQFLDWMPLEKPTSKNRKVFPLLFFVCFLLLSFLSFDWDHKPSPDAYPSLVRRLPEFFQSWHFLLVCVD